MRAARKAAVCFHGLNRGMEIYVPMRGEFVDKSGNGHVFTPQGSPALTLDRLGRTGRAYTLGGTSDYFSAPDTAGLVIGSSGITIAARIKKINTTSFGAIAGQYEPSGNQRSYMFRTDSTGGKVVLQTSGDGVGNKVTITSNQVFSAGVWKHVALVKSGTETIFYIDGIAVADDGTAVDDPLHNSTQPWQVGMQSTGTFPYGGDIAEIRLYKSALTANQMRLLSRLKA